METKVDARLFRSEMVKYGDTNQTLSEYLGIHPTTLTKKIHEQGDRCFDRKELVKIKHRYGWSDEELLHIFFND